MTWNWAQQGWPEFRYDAKALVALERRFLLASGEVLGAFRHVGQGDREQLKIEFLSEEALRTSAIEGEVLDRLSVQSSLRRHLGLSRDAYPVKPREQGVSALMVDVYSGFSAPLDHQTLFRWHQMLLAHDRSLQVIGGYRTHDEAMQIVSGSLGQPTVHFEAPPSACVSDEMLKFVDWFNQTAPDGPAPMAALTRAGMGHLWFESIHPLEDGNGRLGRALAEKSLAQSIGQPSLIALSYTIERDRKAYYDQLEQQQKTLDITAWLVWFAETVLAAQVVTLERVAFFIAKARFYDLHQSGLNDRQVKAIERMFREGPAGFKGGLSAEKYISITGTSPATATRDLHDLMEKGVLTRTGERRHTRYWLNFGVPADQGDRTA